MFVESVRSVIKSPDGQPWEFTLGEKTLIVGRNRRRKSAISIAVQLALSGAADDIHGRLEVKDAHALFALAPDAASAWAHVRLTGGGEAAWGVARSEDGTIRKDHQAPGINAGTVFPLRAIRAALAGDDRTARKQFLTWTGGTVTEADVLARIPAHLHERYRALVKAKGSVKDGPKNPADMLLAIAEYARAEASLCQTNATAQQALVDQLSAGLPGRPTDEDVAAAELAVANAQTVWQQAVAFEAGPVQAPEILQQKRAALFAEQEQAEQAVQGWERVIADIEARRAAISLGPVGATSVTVEFKPLIEVLRRSVDVNSDSCAACKSTPGLAHLAGWLAHYEAETLKEATALELQRAGTNDQRAALMRESAEANASQEGWTNVAYRLRGEIAALDAQIAAAGSTQHGVSPGVSAVDARAHVDACLAHRSRVQQAQGAWTTLQTARDQVASLEAEKPGHDDLRKHCMEAVGGILDKGAEDFAARVQKYLPEDWKFHLRLRDGEREVFEVGYVQDGILRTAASGAEHTTLQCALAMAAVELGSGNVIAPKAKKGRGKTSPIPENVAGAAATPGKPDLWVVIPDDRARDSETLGEIMRAWSKFPGQVILEAIEKPRGKFPAGWTLIDMDAWHAEREALKVKVEPPPAAGAAPALPPPPAAPAASWWYHEESGGYFKWTSEEADTMMAPDGEGVGCVEIGDDAAKAQHMKQAAPSLPPPPPSVATLPHPPPPVAAPSNGHPQDLRDALTALGITDEQAARMSSGSAAYIVRGQVPAGRITFQPDGKLGILDPTGTRIVAVI